MGHFARYICSVAAHISSIQAYILQEVKVGCGNVVVVALILFLAIPIESCNPVDWVVPAMSSP